MTFTRSMYSEEEYQRTANILQNEGIIFADDDRFICFHVSTTYTNQLISILKEWLAASNSLYDYDEDEDLTYSQSEYALILPEHQPNADDEWLRAIYTTEFYQPEEARSLISKRHSKILDE